MPVTNKTSEVWGTSTLDPVDKVIFNWKIENFPRVLRSFGQTGFDSPEFKVTSSDGQVHSLKLRFQQMKVPGGGILDRIDDQEPDNRHIDDFTLIDVTVVNSNGVKFCLAGSLEIFMLNGYLGGNIGDPVLAQFFEESWVFKSYRIYFYYHDSSHGDGEGEFTGFCVDNATQTLKMVAEIFTPGLVTNSVSLVPSESTVKEKGATRLVTDIKSLLDKADLFSDFRIVCGGLMLPCHEAILRARSPVFDSMFQQDMKESSSRELSIEDVQNDTVEAMLEYIYTGGVTKKVKNESELVYVADKYELPGLLELCFHKLNEVDESMVIDILILADRHKLEDFKKVLMHRILMNKARFVQMKEFVTKINQTPLLLMELFQR